MEFKKIDIDKASEEELVSVLKENTRINVKVKEQIQKMSKATESSIIEIKEMPEVVLACTDSEVEEEDDFLEELDYYISEFKNLDWKNIESGLDDVLPTRSNYNYESIVLRLIMEVAKDIKDINEIITEEADTLSKDELKEYKEEIISLNKAINVLRDKLKEEVNTNESVVKENKLVFLPTSLGNIRVFDEIKDIPQEYYSGFLGLFNSIKDGSFKNIRRFESNNKLTGLIEVKDFKIRVAFQRLSKDTYLIVSMFMKKSQRDKGYRKALETRYAECKTMLDDIRKNIEDEDFMQLQKGYEEELFRLLSGEKESDNSCEYTNEITKIKAKKDNISFDKLSNNIDRGGINND